MVKELWNKIMIILYLTNISGCLLVGGFVFFLVLSKVGYRLMMKMEDENETDQRDGVNENV